MKRLITIVAVALAMLIPASALAGGEYPAMTRGWAHEATLVAMREYAPWRYRDSGSVNCNGGRINGHEWSCRVSYKRGYECVHGRSRVVGYYAENGKPWSVTSWQGRYCSVDY